jgi:diadenosine tetraphosphate (Ap4A) HIT family hydrolase
MVDNFLNKAETSAVEPYHFHAVPTTALGKNFNAAPWRLGLRIGTATIRAT